MKLLYGTGNPSKIGAMKKYIDGLDIELLSLNDVFAPDIDIDESGNHPLENAKIKALAYFSALKMSVFSCDSGLYIEGLDDARQPGVHVRRIGGKRLTDDEMIAYYSALASEFGGHMTARYQHSICLVLDENHVFSYAGEDIASEPFYISATPHPRRNEGFPLDSLSVHIESGNYYFEMPTAAKKLAGSGEGFAGFFRRVLMQEPISQGIAIHYNKLIRDNIPAIIRANGKIPVVRALPDGEYLDALNKKLQEEVDEYIASGSIEELCDILEVVAAISEEKGCPQHKLLQLQAIKCEKNGAFSKKLFLEGVCDA